VDRIELLDRTPDTASHLATYNRVDIALDTFPYHGTTTTCEALWMGVPVVTLAGDRHMSRVGASLLQAAGHPEWVAKNTDEYVSIGVGLVSQATQLRSMRGTMRADLSARSLTNAHEQSQRFFSAVRQCWRSRQLAPESVS
jgi:protein O-GlcNAc transferase